MWSLVRPRAQFQKLPVPTSSRIATVGLSTSARQSRCDRGSRTTSRTPLNMHPRTAQMVATAETVEWIQVRNDVEALMLEFNLIKEHRPRFNVRLVDDKSLPVPGRDRERRVGPSKGDAGHEAKGHPLFRALRPCLRHSGHAGSAPTHLSDSNL